MLFWYNFMVVLNKNIIVYVRLYEKIDHKFSFNLLHLKLLKTLNCLYFPLPSIALEAFLIITACQFIIIRYCCSGLGLPASLLTYIQFLAAKSRWIILSLLKYNIPCTICKHICSNFHVATSYLLAETERNNAL